MFRPATRSLRLLTAALAIAGAAAAMAQGKLTVSGRLRVDGGSMDGTRMVVYKDGEKQRTITDLKKFSLDLELGGNYILSFEKEGFVTKKLSFNTNVPGGQEATPFMPFTFVVSLFKQYDGVNIVVFNQPVGMIRYDDTQEEFDYDTDYTKSIQSALEEAQALVEKKQQEEAALAAGNAKQTEKEAKDRARQEAQAAMEAQEKTLQEARAKAEQEKARQAAMAKEAQAKAEQEARLVKEAEAKAQEDAQAKAAQEKVQQEARARQAQEQEAQDARAAKEAEEKALQEARAAKEASDKAREEAQARKMAEDKAARESALAQKAAAKPALPPPRKEAKPAPRPAPAPVPRPVAVSRPIPPADPRPAVAADPVSGSDARVAYAPRTVEERSPVRPAEVHAISEPRPKFEPTPVVPLRTKDVLVEPGQVVTVVRVETGDLANEYRKVVRKYSGTYYFKDGNSCSQITWEREALAGMEP
jgi:hypothetical protein